MCDAISEALRDFSHCEETEHGARIPTHCLYPSFERVHVYVFRFGDGFRVHDRDGAFVSAWDHGREPATIARYINREAAKHRIGVDGRSLTANVSSIEWLEAAIVTVANASAAAANTAVAHFAKSAESGLRDKIEIILRSEFRSFTVSSDFTCRGISGKEYRFDFGLESVGKHLLLIDAVAPHHTSVTSKYVAFADAARDALGKFAVHDVPLDDDDKSLLQQVADIVPLRSLALGTRRVMGNA